MVRAIIAVIVSYVLMFVLMFVSFTGIYLLLGPEGAFKPGVYDASNLWIVIQCVVTFLTAVVAGFVCVAIARNGRVAMGLAIAIFVFGMVLAIPSVIANKSNPDVTRPANVSNMEAMQKAKEPMWAPFLFPLIGVAGALVGGKLKRQG